MSLITSVVRKWSGSLRVVVEGVNDGIRPSVGFLYVLFSSAVRIIKLLCLLPN